MCYFLLLNLIHLLNFNKFCLSVLCNPKSHNKFQAILFMNIIKNKMFTLRYVLKEKNKIKYICIVFILKKKGLA